MAIPDELLAFIKDALARGVPRAQIETVLDGAGWDKEQVSAGLARFAESEFPIPVPRPAPYLSAREAFLYLLLFTTLYISGYHLATLFIQFINLALPDPAANRYLADPANIHREIRWAIAALIVAFPVFLYLSALTAREVARDPVKRASMVRRWLTYLTLFVAAGVIIGDLIALFNDLLGGELTLRFMLKALTVGAISGALFAYYLRDARTVAREPPA